jgi:hypothetical protein
MKTGKKEAVVVTQSVLTLFDSAAVYIAELKREKSKNCTRVSANLHTAIYGTFAPDDTTPHSLKNLPTDSYELRSNYNYKVSHK